MIKYGIWGCGSHALQSHAVPGLRVPNLKLVALHDLNSEAFDQFRSAISDPACPGFSEASGFLEVVDAVVVATPDEHHIACLRAAIQAGKHVLMEKPLANTPQELDELRVLLNLAREKGLVVSSCHPRRFDPPFVWLKQALPGFVAQLGGVVKFDFDFSYHRPTLEWKQTRSLLLDHMNHEIDLVHFLFGSAGFSAVRLSDGFDQYAVAGARKDLSFVFHGTRRLVSQQFLEWATIRHERGEVHLDTESGVVTVRDHETGYECHEVCGHTDYALRFKRVMANFAAAIQGTEESYLSERDLIVNSQAGAELVANGKVTIDE